MPTSYYIQNLGAKLTQQVATSRSINPATTTQIDFGNVRTGHLVLFVNDSDYNLGISMKTSDVTFQLRTGETLNDSSQAFTKVWVKNASTTTGNFRSWIKGT